jgi:hypothetical protein
VIVLATVVSNEFVRDGPLPSQSTSTGYSGTYHSMNRSIRDATIPPPSFFRVTLHVSEWFRGKTGDGSLVVEMQGGDCDYPFETGHEYLVFANEFQGHLATGICTATRPAKMALTTIQQLRAVRDGTPLPDLFGFVGTHPDEGGEAGWEQVEPVPGLTVTAKSPQGEYQTQTADDGSYAFNGLPAGGYQVSVQPPPRRLVYWAGSADHVGVGAGPGNVCATNFQVFYDGRISGTVTRQDGQPVSGDVFVLYSGPENLHAGSAGSRVKDGHFEITRLRPGLYRLAFQPSLRTHAIYYPGTLSFGDATPIEVGDGTHVDGVRFNVSP